jgi:hypothetical protein
MLSFSPYKLEEFKAFKKDLRNIIILTAIFFLALYLAPLIRFGDKISISDWPIPQENSKNATFYLPSSPTPEDIRIHEYYNEYLRSYVPGVFDLILFNFALSIDTIVFGGEPSKIKYYYTFFALIKNLFNTITILRHVEWGYLSNFTIVYDNIDNYSNWVSFAFLRFAPLYILRNFLYLPNVTALLKLAKNLADIEMMIKLRGKKVRKVIRTFLYFTRGFTVFLYILYFIFIFIPNLLALFYGFVLGGLINPIIFIAIYFLSCFCCFPLYFWCFLQEYYTKSKEKQENSSESISLMDNQSVEALSSINNDNKENLNDPIQRKKFIESTIKNRQVLYLIVRFIILFIYTTLSFEIFYVAANDWPAAARFTFNLPYLGFNVYAFDFSKKLKTNMEYVNLVLNLI